MSQIGDTGYYLTGEGEARRHQWAIDFNNAVHFLRLPCGYVGCFDVRGAEICYGPTPDLYLGYGCANDPSYVAVLIIPHGMWYRRPA